MINTETIKCPHCGYDTLLPKDEPLYISLNEDYICPKCGKIIIFSQKVTY